MLSLPRADAGDEVVRGGFLCLGVDSQRIHRTQPNGYKRRVFIDLDTVTFKLAEPRFRIREYFRFLFEHAPMTETKAHPNTGSL